MSAETPVASVAPLTPDVELDELRRQVRAEHLTGHSAGWVAFRTAALVAIWCGSSALGLGLGRWEVWAGVWWLQALCLVGSYSAMHEGTHGSLARRRSHNQVLAAAWGLTILWNAALWRQFHLAHHAYTGTDRDPEPSEEATTVGRYLLGIPLAGIGFVVAQWALSARVALTGTTPAWSRASGRRAARLNGVALLAWTAVLAAATAAQPGLVVRLWLAPYLLAVLLVAPATGMTEHYGCARGGRSSDPFAASRSIATNRVIRFLFWQNNFHAAHHAFPTVPAHHAARLHQAAAGRTVHLASGYVSFHVGELRALAARSR